MDLAELKGIVRQRLRSQPFTVSGAVVESPAITTLLTGAFGTDGCTVEGARVTSDTASEITVRGVLREKVAGLTQQPVSITFTVVGSQAEAHIELAELGADWQPSTSFPVLGGSVLDSFEFSSPVLNLDSDGRSALPPGFPASHGYPEYSADLRARMVQGMSLRASLKPKSGGELLSWLLGPPPWEVSGPVALPAEYPSIVLSSQVGHSVQLGGIKVGYSLNPATLAVISPHTEKPVPTSGLQLVGELNTTLNSGAVRIPFVVRQNYLDSSLTTVESAVPPATGITVAQIAELLGITDSSRLTSQLPQGFPQLSEVHLDGVSLTIAPHNRQVVSASVTVRWQPETRYEVLGGLISFRSLALTFTYLAAPVGGTPCVLTDVTAEAAIGGSTLTAGISPAEGTFWCELGADEGESGDVVDLTALVKQTETTGSVPMPAVVCTWARVFGDVATGTYRVQASAGDWKLKFSTSELVVSEVSLDIAKDSTGFSGQIVGQLAIAGVRLFGRAEYHGKRGWVFQLGTLESANISLTALAAEAAGMFDLHVPATLPDLTLDSVNVTFDVATGEFTFACGATLDLPSGTAALGVEITKNSFTGLLWIGDSYFEIDLTKQGKDKSFTATWQAADQKDALKLSTIIREFGADAPAIPSPFDIALTSATVRYDGTDHGLAVAATSQQGDVAFVTLPKRTTPTTMEAARVVLATVRLDAGLADLPALGPQIPPDLDLRLAGVRVVAASRALTTDADVKRVNAMLASVASSNPTLRLPADGMTGKTLLGLAVVIRGETLVLGAPDGAGPKNLALPPAAPGTTATGQRPGLGPSATGERPRSGSGEPARAEEGTAGTLWHQVDLALGPVRLDRLGVRYDQGTVWLLVDAGVDIGGLVLSGRGLGLGIPLADPQHITPCLEGLGVAWARPPLELSGAFVNERNPDYLVKAVGAAVLTAPTLSVSAVGGYAQRVGQQPSLFVFGQLGFAEGQGLGPPPFRITGAAAGFGYNTSVRSPDITEVDVFPFMPAEKGGGTDAMALLDSLTKGTGGGKPWLSEAPGRVWLAAGLRFDSFQFVHCRALALGEFSLEGDREFTLALLGHASADFPLRTTGAARYAHVGLTLAASYTSYEDALRVKARIQPGSYLVHPSCKLSGDAAFALWFGRSPHAGDFVLTVGGYHPRFVRPAHYPAADRLRLEWDWGPVSLRGACYAALTPSAFMVGAELQLAFHEGPISAWCRAVLDALVQWDPFQFRVGLSVRIGVHIDILIPINAEIGVDLDLWGPPTGGIAHVHVVFGWTFDIRFGEDPPAAPKRLGWDDFVARMLPGPVVQVVVESGRLPARPANGTEEQRDEICEMSREGFTALTRSTVPAEKVRIVTPSTPDGRAPANAQDGKAIAVRPVGADRASSVHKITVSHDGQVIDPEAAPYRWTVVPQQGKVPLALWGAPLASADNSPPMPDARKPELVDAVTGTRITAPRPEPAPDPVAATEKAISWECEQDAETPLPSAGQAGPAPTRPYPRSTLATELTTTDRQVFAEGLHTCGVALPPGGSLTDSLREYTQHLHSYLRADPMAQLTEAS
ncbi:DUF6603 domain-containing protein [Streptantibioticus ferralitis]|uniref:DUF6603 domain-containing protein n=1 Tax=Streptantibioticus ferralitis TaxID=236510 RepID=A0ABT5Z0Q8_9ACTN|nr:DUF6603 domain-containing protein [Streptantibioticus ferralitis]MDF2257421.1 hypothetical protein [Streptantibioticus ferralitis]